MGVTGLWEVVQPCARPIKIDTLNKKRLAIDASIWVYHFLKAVRDKEGNALRNSHVVGFYRRICKLLFFGIKPVFVFDGGAPVLKRQTITGRKARRKGRREDATRTAGKLLALQMQRAAEEEEERQRREAERPLPVEDNEEAVPENPVYVDELQMTQQERQQNRKFRKKDQYHLPDLSMSLGEMGGANDPRVMSLEELQHYAKQFETGEDINVYDFSKIDFDSPFFTSLPASDRYNILNAARLRSRLRMGYSKDQLEEMFPNRMAFSRFQIDRVRERNELTQRLMQVGTPEDGMFADASGRIAGEKGREYVLVRNPDVEGGWALGVIGDNDKEEGKREKPIDIEEKAKQAAREKEEDERPVPSSESEDEEAMSAEIQKRREAFYGQRRNEARPEEKRTRTKKPVQEDENSLFVAEDAAAEQSGPSAESSEADDSDDEEAQMQIAIAMSLEGADEEAPKQQPRKPKLPKQQRAPQAAPFAGSKGSVASIANARAHRAAPKVTAACTSDHESSSEEDTMDLQGALAESRQSKYRPSSPRAGGAQSKQPAQSQQNDDTSAKATQQKSTGPLPFEKLDLGSSLLGKKKMKQIEEDNAGGFEKDLGKHNDDKPAQPAPPWFASDVEKGIASQRDMAAEERRQAQQVDEDNAMFQPLPPKLRKEKTNEVIDLDAMEEERKKTITIESSGEEDDNDADDGVDGMENVEVVDPEVRLGDMAERVRAEPPKEQEQSFIPAPAEPTGPHSIEAAAAKIEQEKPELTRDHVDERAKASPTPKRNLTSFMEDEERSDEEVEWEASDHEAAPAAKRQKTSPEPMVSSPEQANDETAAARSESPDDGDVYMPDDFVLKEWEAQTTDAPNEQDQDNNQRPSAAAKDPTDNDKQSMPAVQDGNEQQEEEHYEPATTDLATLTARERSRSPSTGPAPASGAAAQASEPHPVNFDDDLPFSDNESDDDLMASLAAEAEEHARFTSTFNSKTPQQNILDYESELKALRNQQKTDRRDADEVTTIMIQECQQLLKLFGLPYVTAPMEAEAQCAELVRLGLVDGIVTDDSDIFLFGGTRIYKNMFNQAKYVECYLASDLSRDFDLTRAKMINIAHLLGSDYTEGLPGVGPVTALELIADFPDGLSDFREWFTNLQQGQPLTDEDKTSPFRRKFRKQTTKLFLPPSFPDQRVDLAYLHPEVDHDPSPFQWGVPDLDALRSFLMATVGWTQARTDEVLVPVIRDMNRRENEGTQANITAFLGGNVGTGAGAFAPRVRAEGKSRRMEAVLERMAARARVRKREGGGQEKGAKEKGAKGGGVSEEAIISVSGSVVDGSAGASAADVVSVRPDDVDDDTNGDVGGDAETAQRQNSTKKGNKTTDKPKTKRQSRKKPAKARRESDDDEDEDSDNGSEFEDEKPKRKAPGGQARRKVFE